MIQPLLENQSVKRRTISNLSCTWILGICVVIFAMSALMRSARQEARRNDFEIDVGTEPGPSSQSAVPQPASPPGMSSQPNSDSPFLQSDSSRGYFSPNSGSPRSVPASISRTQSHPSIREPPSLSRSNSAGAIIQTPPHNPTEMEPDLPPLETFETVQDLPPQPPTAKCDDPTVGYAALVGQCSDIRYHRIWLTLTGSVFVPMVIDHEAFCRGERCKKRDKWICCRKRRSCKEYPNDVAEGCPENQIVNPYEFAFCQTIPCTVADAHGPSGCCIAPTGILFERLSETRSEFAKQLPNNAAPPASPHMNFGHRKIAWLDASVARQVVDGEEWVQLYDFMGSWGMGWSTPAWIKLTGVDTQYYRDLNLKIYHLTCEQTVDDVLEFQSEVDTYLVSCPRLCFGRPQVRDGSNYYRWKFSKNQFTKKGIPLYRNVDDPRPAAFRKFKQGETFVSQALTESRGERIWVRLPGGEFLVPVLLEKEGEVLSIVDQVVPEVRGCGGTGFLQDEWFTSDSPICVAARSVGIHGGIDDMLEVTIGPRKQSYKGCTHGGIQTSSLEADSAVRRFFRRSFRIGRYGTEMMRKGGSYIDRTLYSLWNAHTESIQQEGPVKVLVKLAFKAMLYLNIMFFSGELIELTAPLEGTPYGYLCMVGFGLGRPAYALTMSITIDTGIDYLFPRTRDFIKKQLDLGPTASARRKQLIKLSTSFCTQFKIQAELKGYLIFVSIEAFLATLVLLEVKGQWFHVIVGRLAQLEILNRLKRLRPMQRQKPEEYDLAAMNSPPQESEYFNPLQLAAPSTITDVTEPHIVVDYSIAFMTKISERIRELFDKIVPPEGEEPTLSRLDVFGWIAGFDVSKISVENFEEDIERECEPPRCILKDFSLNEKGVLSIGAEALPALAENLGIDWEIRQIHVNKKWFSTARTPDADSVTVAYFALKHEDLAVSADILSKLCPDGSAEKCPNIEMNIEGRIEDH